MKIGFDVVFLALKSGRRVRQSRMQLGNHFVIENDELFLVTSKGRSPWQFDWREMNRKDWVILE